MWNYNILLNLPATITHNNAIILSCLRSALHNIEDFGIIPIESQAAGVPVIARGSGGSLETIVEGSTGLLFQRIQSPNFAQQSRDLNLNRGSLRYVRAKHPVFRRKVYRELQCGFRIVSL